MPIPYDRRLQDLYLPTTLTSDEYPNLLAPGETVDTLAASVMLVSFNWPEKSDHYRRMAKFVDAFFSKFNEFHKPPRHPKWSEASLNIKILRDGSVLKPLTSGLLNMLTRPCRQWIRVRLTAS